MKEKWVEEKHEPRREYYSGSRGVFKRRRLSGNNKSACKSSITKVKESLALGRDKKGNGEAMGKGRKELGWWAREEVASIIICAIISLNVSQALSFEANGSIYIRVSSSQVIYRT